MASFISQYHGNDDVISTVNAVDGYKQRMRSLNCQTNGQCLHSTTHYDNIWHTNDVEVVNR